MDAKTFAPLKNLLQRLNAEENVALAPFSTLKVGGPARFLVKPHTVEDIASIQRACQDAQVDLHILSGGSNTLFSDEGFSGVVMKLAPAFDFMQAGSDGLSLCVGAATPFAKVTKTCLARGFSEALGFLGTPGLIGGAVRMNAGTRLGEIKDAVARVYGILNGKSIQLDKEEIEFDYRRTNLPKDLIIYKVDLSFNKCLIVPEQYLLPKAQEYREKRRLTQPANNSLGSFFKNPYPAFAAQLIEKCNLKGLKYNSAQISPLHANFIINNGGASAKDILHIAKIAQNSVLDKFGIMLKKEVRTVGRFDDAPSLQD